VWRNRDQNKITQLNVRINIIIRDINYKGINILFHLEPRIV